MAKNLTPISKVPFSDEVPQGSQSVLSALNQALLAGASDSKGFQIKQLTVITPDPWINLTLQNAWAGSAQFMKHYDGTVQIVAALDSSAALANTTAFTMPDGARPKNAAGLSWMAPTALGGAYGVGFMAPCVLNQNGTFVPKAVFPAASVVHIQLRFMPVDNRPLPLSCFPVDVKVDSKSPPKAVVTISNRRLGEDTRPTCPALNPSWRFINGRSGPTVQILDIPGLEYGCKQTVQIAIIGG